MRRFTAFVLVEVIFIALFIPFIFSHEVYADGTVYVSIDAPETVNKGDIFKIDIAVDHVPHIVRFEDLEVYYNFLSVEYVDCDISSELQSGFVISSFNDLARSKIVLNGCNEEVEDMLNEASLSEVDEFDDPSFYSDKKVVLCSLTFRLKANPYDTISFSVEDNGAFIDSSFNTINIEGQDSRNVNISSDISSDSTAYSILVDNSSVFDFNSNVLEYNINVDSDSKSIIVDVIPYNLNSQITISNTDLTFGNNDVVIDVLAQDGIGMTSYVLHVFRQSSNIRETASFIDDMGNIYSFVSAPEELDIPDRFFSSTTVINNYEVACYRREGVFPVLIYVFDGEGDTGLFFYDSNTNKVIPYVDDRTLVKRSSIMTIIDRPSSVSIPEGFVSTTFMYEKKAYEGYRNRAGELICYMENERGEAAFYKFDFDSQTFNEYVPVNRTREYTYRFLLNVVLIIAISEALFIVFIVYVVRKFRKDRVNPRPRRV